MRRGRRGRRLGGHAATPPAGSTAGNGRRRRRQAGGTLTIQGDAGNPTPGRELQPVPAVSRTARHIPDLRAARDPAARSTASFTPFLATGYKFTDPTTLVYTIRQGVKWSDGKPFTPTDVVFTFNLLKKYPALDTQRRLGSRSPAWRRRATTSP